jgi:hypothetical protein
MSGATTTVLFRHAMFFLLRTNSSQVFDTSFAPNSEGIICFSFRFEVVKMMENTCLESLTEKVTAVT